MSELQVADALYEKGPCYVHGFKSLRKELGGWVVILARKGKGRFSTKWLESKNFSDYGEAIIYFNELREKADSLEKVEREKKETKRSNRANALAIYKAGTPNPWKEGDLCHTSWGYDQTNVEAYQVVKILSRTKMLVRRIGGGYEATGYDQGRFTPKRNNFIGEPEVVSAGFSVGYEGAVYESWKDPRFHSYGLYPTKDGESHYTSSYA